MKKVLLLLLLCLITILIAYFFLTKEKVVGNTIILGQSSVQSGTTGKIGRELTSGANAYFSYINENGGVFNRKIQLETMDNFYEPEYSRTNTQYLIKEKNVFAMFGEFGTPTSLEALAVAKGYDVPFLVPFTGAQFLRQSDQSLVINLRNSYYSETEALVTYLISQYKSKKFAVFYQNDSYGKSGYQGVKKALEKFDLKIVSQGSYRRNTLSYRNALNQIKKTNPDAIIMIGSYKAGASFIKSARREGLTNTKFCNISFVGTTSLVNALEKKTQNVLFSQVVPNPWDIQNVAIKEYQEIYSKYYPNEPFSFVSLEGFLSAKLIVKGLEKTGQELTRKRFLKAFEQLDKNSLEGFTINFSQEQRQVFDKVFILDFDKNKFRLLKEVTIR